MEMRRVLCVTNPILYMKVNVPIAQANDTNKYDGETSRTGYTRIKEHIDDYRAAALANLPEPQPEDF